MTQFRRSLQRLAAYLSARVGLVMFIIGVAVLARTHLYYGALLRGWDAQYYYATAHSIVFDRDLDITNNLQTTPFAAPFDRNADGYFEAVPRDPTGRIVTIYPIGLPLIEVPFLALGYGARRGLAALGMSSPQPPGYGEVEIWAVALGLLAVFSIGGQLLDAILRPQVPSPWRAFALVAAWWGTSLLYYSSVFPFMAHAVAFTIIVWTVWIGWRVGARLCSPRCLWLLGFALGALYLVRQQQVVIVVPLLLVLTPVVRQPARLWAGWAAAGIATLLALIAFQASAHARLGGAWALDAARLGLLDWLHPDLWTVLISPARGLLWISPIVLLATAGFIATPPRRVPRPFGAFALHGLIQVYLVACWVFPEQGEAFGMRMWAECAGAVACGVGLLFLRRSSAARFLVSAAIAACLIWTNRLLLLYVSGRLRIGMSYSDCLRLVFGS